VLPWGVDGELTPFELSRRTWEAQRDGACGSYVFTLESQSWTGYALGTTMFVEQGQVVRRIIDITPAPDTDQDYTYIDEECADVGASDEGHRVRTLDDLYDECEDVLQRDPTENEIVFETDRNGIVSRCYSINDFCADDCNDGFILAHVEVGVRW